MSNADSQHITKLHTKLFWNTSFNVQMCEIWRYQNVLNMPICRLKTISQRAWGQVIFSWCVTKGLRKTNTPGDFLLPWTQAWTIATCTLQLYEAQGRAKGCVLVLLYKFYDRKVTGWFNNIPRNIQAYKCSSLITPTAATRHWKVQCLGPLALDKSSLDATSEWKLFHAHIERLFQHTNRFSCTVYNSHWMVLPITGQINFPNNCKGILASIVMWEYTFAYIAHKWYNTIRTNFGFVKIFLESLEIKFLPSYDWQVVKEMDYSKVPFLSERRGYKSNTLH